MINQHQVRSLSGGGQQSSAVRRPDGIEALEPLHCQTSTLDEAAP
jgi:hypothetical protein